MSIPALLSEKEIKDIYENPGPPMEALVVYGWARIVTTLVAYNVLRKRIQDPGEMDWTVYKSCPLCKRPGPHQMRCEYCEKPAVNLGLCKDHDGGGGMVKNFPAATVTSPIHHDRVKVPGVVPGTWLEETIAEHRESPRVIMVCKHCGRDQATWARTSDGACSYCYGEKSKPAPTACTECGGKIVVDKIVNGITISTPCTICCAGR
jgi:hypothetical protein